jgi:hypothetical protein
LSPICTYGCGPAARALRKHGDLSPMNGYAVSCPDTAYVDSTRSLQEVGFIEGQSRINRYG